MIPSDDYILLSFINMKLRDFYDSLDSLCSDLELDSKNIIDRLNRIGYYYDRGRNQFISN